MATVGTSTNGNPIQYAAGTQIVRHVETGYLYASLINNGGNVEIFRSTDNGGSWSSYATWTHSGIQEHIMKVTQSRDLHVVIRTNESSQDRIYYRRYSILNNGWVAAETQLGTAANGGVAGAVYGGIDVVHWYRTSSAEHYTAVGAAVTVGAQHGVELFGLYDNPYGGFVPGWNNAIVGMPSGAPRRWLWTGSGRIGLSMDTEHSGDDQNAAIPTIWITAGRTSLRIIRLGWYGNWWEATEDPTVLLPSIPAQNSLTGRWDGTRHLSVVPNPNATDTVILVERDKANSTTVQRISNAHPTGAIRSCTLAYDPTTGDVRVYAVGTSTAVLYYASYARGAGTWTGWSTVSATAILGGTPENYSVRRSAYGGVGFDVLTAHSGTPNTIVHTRQSLTYPPTVPSWVSPTNGTAAWVSAVLTLDWSYTGLDPADAQTAYALRRQIGAGAFSYFRASDGTWQATEQKNTTATTARTIAGAWGSGSDANYSFSVKIWNSADVASSYSSALVIVPSVEVLPTITYPTASMVYTGSRITVTWTVAEQSSYRVTLVPVGGAAVHDSGWRTGTATSYAIPYDMPDGGSWTVFVQTANLEGLVGTFQFVSFTTDYVEPPAPITAATPMASSGIIRVTPTHPAPSGTQPAVQSLDVYRREAGVWSTPINSNPYFETNASGWSPTNGTITRSTVQAHQGVASLRLVPTGGIVYANALSAGLTVNAGELHTGSAWYRPDTANKPLTMWIFWYTAGSAAFISSVQRDLTPVAGVWLYMELSAVAPATAAVAYFGVGVSGTPAAGDAAYIDEAKFVRGNAGTPVRLAAGVTSGTPVDDWRAKSGVTYEYRAVATAVNGTIVEGPWSP